MTTVTVDPSEVRHGLRRAGDTLPRALIGTVPILWANSADAARREGTATLDEIARLGYEARMRSVA